MTSNPTTSNRTLIEVALDDPQADETLRQLGTTLLAVGLPRSRATPSCWNGSHRTCWITRSVQLAPRLRDHRLHRYGRRPCPTHRQKHRAVYRALRSPYPVRA